MGVIAVAIVVIIIVSSQHSLAVPPEIKKEQEDHHRQIGLRSSGFQSAVNEEPDESFVFIIKDEDEKPVKTTTNENVQRPEKTLQQNLQKLSQNRKNTISLFRLPYKVIGMEKEWMIQTTLSKKYPAIAINW